jgi:hypothetical protein
MERATFIKRNKSDTFDTGHYQAGFKKGGSCGYDQARLLAELNKNKRKGKKNKLIYTLLDITKAFDSVIRPKLWNILDSRIARKRFAEVAAFKARPQTEVVQDEVIAAKLGINLETY